VNVHISLPTGAGGSAGCLRSDAAAKSLIERQDRTCWIAITCPPYSRSMLAVFTAQGIGLRYRALAVDDGQLWFWISSHADYDATLKQGSLHHLHYLAPQEEFPGSPRRGNDAPASEIASESGPNCEGPERREVFASWWSRSVGTSSSAFSNARKASERFFIAPGLWEVIIRNSLTSALLGKNCFRSNRSAISKRSVF
jgi:hypothetical protein